MTHHRRQQEGTRFTLLNSLDCVLDQRFVPAGRSITDALRDLVLCSGKLYDGDKIIVTEVGNDD